LLLHISLGYGAGTLHESIGKGAFPMVNMGNNRKVADELGRGHGNAEFGLLNT
jgi:hypothetical protein